MCEFWATFCEFSDTFCEFSATFLATFYTSK